MKESFLINSEEEDTLKLKIFKHLKYQNNLLFNGYYLF